ncbi:MAG: hypothetical protein ACFBWO_07100 [Paracoccaceae bacterium]
MANPPFSHPLYVRLLDEGVDVCRPVKAEWWRHGLLRIVGPISGDADGERWEFPPGSIVGWRFEVLDKGAVRLAVSPKYERELTSDDGVYVRVIEEGMTAYAPVPTEPAGDDPVRIVAPPEGYDHELDCWEFPPGSLVRVRIGTPGYPEMRLAVAPDDEP